MKHFFLALLTGLLLASGWPTYGFPILLFFGFVPLLISTYRIKQNNLKYAGWRVFGLSYVAFFIFNIITTWWLYCSTPFGMWFAILANTLLMALVWQLYYFVSKKNRVVTSLVFVVSLWMLFEKMHLIWEFAWPWLNLGNGFATYTQWIQWYEYTGTFGGTLWVWAGNCILFWTFIQGIFARRRSVIFRGSAYFILLLIIPIAWSLYLSSSYTSTGKPVDVVLLQPNIDPYTEKYNSTNEQIADLLFEDAVKALDADTDFLIAPETVLAEGYGVDLRGFDFSPEKTKAQNFLATYPDLNYLTGIQFYRFYRNENDIISTSNYLGKDRMGNPIWGDFFNSAVMLNQSTKSQIYHKSKLVVGVENFPYQSVLKPLLGDTMLDLGGTVAMKTTQDDRGVFTGIDQTTVGPIICYESIFGEFVTGYVANGAQFLAVITNDAWWDDTQGHKQHLNYARLRAIETRRDIARSANTGISAIINQKGEIVKQLDYAKRGTVKGKIYTNSQQTVYVKYGDYLAKIATIPVIIILLLSLIPFKKKARA